MLPTGYMVLQTSYADARLPQADPPCKLQRLAEFVTLNRALPRLLR